MLNFFVPSEGGNVTIDLYDSIDPLAGNTLTSLSRHPPIEHS